MRTPGRPSKQDRIWNTSTQEERERIKEFWLSLSEQDRKSLLKIEKTAVLNKMKEQQKHSCSCTVCGRKRTAIEEELEVLYDAYYEELAQYANQPNQDPTDLVEKTRLSLPYHHSEALPPRPLNTGQAPQHRTSRVHEIIDDEQEQSDEEEEVYSEDDEELYSDEEEDYESDVPTGVGAGFFDFGNNLTVKDGILTVADDLLKNDGRKFIEMMEQLAERRMQREQEVEYASQQPSHTHSHGEPPLDDEEDFDDEDDYDSQDDYEDEEEEDDMGGMTEEQRMEEGRRMFQIFAARMFEQRVLTAYREKVALERQSKLLEELEEEDKAKTQKDAKKARDAEKKKNKKAAQKQAKAEEKAKKDAEKAAEEAAAKEAEEKRLEEQRRKKEEQRRKKEAEKRALEDERLRKEAERVKRQQEERDRQAEADRKAREQKAQEKRLKDEQRRKEREDREAREREAREQKAHHDKQRRDVETRDKASKPPAATPQIIKRPSQAGAGQVAVPPALSSQKSSSGVSSPHVAVATPALPKPATPGTRTRQSSEHESHPSSKFAEQTAYLAKTRSPPSADSQPNMAPKTILQNPNKHQPPQQPQRPTVTLPQPSTHQSNHPPSGHPPFSGGFGNMAFAPYGGPQGPHVQRPGAPPFPPPAGLRSFQPAPGGPPGANGFGALPQDRAFAGEAPPGFQPPVPGLGQHNVPYPGRAPGPTHSRQNSTNETETSPHGPSQPISRPAPIQRPSSVRPSGDGSSEMDDLNRHLGSRALLDDADDPIPTPIELRRASNPMGAGRGAPAGFSSPLFGSAPGFGASPSTWSSPHAFGPAPPGMPTPNWNAGLGSNSWTSNFNPLGTGPRGTVPNRPRAVRLAVCNACRQLSSNIPNPNNTEYHDVSLILQHMDRSGASMALEAPPSLKEIEDICETEGDNLNGGGLLHVRRSGPSSFAVMFESDSARPPNQLGEIGSPVPGNSLPVVGGFGPPRGGFGAIGGMASAPGGGGGGF